MEPGSETPGSRAASARALLERAAVVAVDVVKVYGEGEAAVRALDGVSLVVPKGRFVAIMGPSGSGKSTLLHCLAALDEVTSGKVFVGGIEVSRLAERERTLLRRDKVGFVFQAFNLVPTLNALENITLPMSLGGRSPDRKWLDYLIETVGLGDRLHHLPSELSGGQQQRVAAARALAGRPDIVFADEPTGNLDSRRGQELLQFLRRTVDDFSQTIVMVTHDPFAAAYADSVVFLADGKVVQQLDNPKADQILDLIKTLEG